MGDEGRFVRHELRVPDADAGARFYSGLFGWTFEPNPMGSTIRSGGAVIGGLSAVKPGLPSHWTPYVACADVHAVAAAARDGGGIVTSGEPADVPGLGRIAPILDNHRTIFAAFAPLDGDGPPGEGGPGSFVWERLRTPDPAASAAFYQAAVGWRPTLAPDGDGGVFELANGTRVAELVRSEEAGWLPFVLVERLDDARAKAAGLGGTELGEPTEVADTGRFVTIQDPQGATLAIHEAAR